MNQDIDDYKKKIRLTGTVMEDERESAPMISELKN